MKLKRRVGNYIINKLFDGLKVSGIFKARKLSRTHRENDDVRHNDDDDGDGEGEKAVSCEVVETLEEVRCTGVAVLAPVAGDKGTEDGRAEQSTSQENQTNGGKCLLGGDPVPVQTWFCRSGNWFHDIHTEFWWQVYSYH